MSVIPPATAASVSRPRLIHCCQTTLKLSIAFPLNTLSITALHACAHVPPATASAEGGAQRVFNGAPFPATASAEGRLIKGGPSLQACEPEPHAVEIEVHHRRGVEREQLAHEQPADDGDAERPPY